ncbi:MAG: YbhB/YbcL family Raf kinase inhibitor-like protein [Actinobacteria bacterium HGW-Actinobacteria-10]|jgi:hypothetical protein|nr:MAG: YbhB/YbcL family Raf kinase inhibitor-like protein [Actinobacteria bacterium HGW-Actinobacteria-10]
MIVNSSAFQHGGEIPRKHGKKFGNVSPQLSWSGAPPETRSYALLMVDTHPVARGFVHWMVVDTDSATTSLPEGASGSQMPTGAREARPYMGPFPPSGTHDYEFTVYALDADSVAVGDADSAESFAAAVRPHALDTGTFVGTFTTM